MQPPRSPPRSQGGELRPQGMEVVGRETTWPHSCWCCTTFCYIRIRCRLCRSRQVSGNDFMERHGLKFCELLLLLLRSPAISLGFTIPLLLLRSPTMSLGSPFYFFFCVPQLYLWGSPFYFFFCVPSCISGLHHSSSVFPAISLGFTILLLLCSPTISLGFTILLLLLCSQLYLWGSPFRVRFLRMWPFLIQPLR